MDEKKNIPKEYIKLMGTGYLQFTQLLLLSYAHPEECIFLPFDLPSFAGFLYKKGRNHTNYNLWWDADEKKIHWPSIIDKTKTISKSNRIKEMIEILRKCEKNEDGNYKNFIVMPISLIKKGVSGHLNVIIFDRKNKSVERYEPNGNSTPLIYNPSSLDKNIVKIFRIILKINDLSYFNPQKFCPTRGLQLEQAYVRNEEYAHALKKGSCSLWSFIYTHMRLFYPYIPRENITILTHGIIESKIDLHKFIMIYLEMLVKLTHGMSSNPSIENINFIMNIGVKSLNKLLMVTDPSIIIEEEIKMRDKLEKEFIELSNEPA